MARVRQQMYKERTHPVFAGDFSGREHNLAGGAQVELAEFIPAPASGVVNGALDAGDTSLDIDAAFGVELKDGDRIYHAAGPQTIIVDGDHASTATTIKVRALQKAVADDAALVAVPTKRIRVQPGTVVGRTRAERDANVGFGPAATDGSDEEVYIVLFGTTDAETEPEIELYRHGSLVYENLLPNWDTLDANVKAQVRANYECTVQTEQL